MDVTAVFPDVPANSTWSRRAVKLVRGIKIPKRGTNRDAAVRLTYRVLELTGRVLLVLTIGALFSAISTSPAEPLDGLFRSTELLAKWAGVVYALAAAWLIILRKAGLAVADHSTLHVPPVYQVLVLIVPLLLIDGQMLSEHFPASLGHLIPSVISLFVSAQLMFIERPLSENDAFLRRVQGPFFGHSLVEVSTLKSFFRLHQFVAFVRCIGDHFERYITMFEVGTSWEWRRMPARDRRALLNALRLTVMRDGGLEEIPVAQLPADSNGMRFLSKVCRAVGRITGRTICYRSKDGRVFLTPGARDGLMTVMQYKCAKKGGRR